MSENDEPLIRDLNITADIIERLKDPEFAAEWLKAQDEGVEALHADLENLRVAKDATIKSLSRKLEEARGRIAELEQQLKHEKASHEILAEDFAEVYGEREKGFARIAELEAAIKPFAEEADNPEFAGMADGDLAISFMSIAIGDLRNARNKLEGKSDA